jgi:DNA-binding transcriptional LysR family regulator
MNFLMLHEYIEFAKHLNFSSAAKALHLSQSTLSKHIAELERCVGFELVVHEQHPTLTPAGKVFLESVEQMTFIYQNAIDQCLRISKEFAGSITIQDPIIDSTIAYQSLEVYSFFSQNYPLIEIKLHTISGETVREALNERRVDIGYYMAYGDRTSVVKRLDKEGFISFPLRFRNYSVWMRKNHPLAERPRLSFADLKGFPFLVPSDKLFEDWAQVLIDASRAHGFTPIINLKVTPTINGYFAVDTKQGVIILSDAFLQDPRFLMRTDMITRNFDDPNTGYTMFTIYHKDNKNPVLPLFVEQLEEASARETFPD